MKKTLFAGALLLLPGFAFAQVSLQPITQFVGAINVLEGSVIPVLIAAGLIVFLFGLIRYLWDNKGDAKKHSENKSVMLWGLVALFVMVSVWGIVRLGQQAFGISGNETINTPIVPSVGAH
jgi:hypothetical protein